MRTRLRAAASSTASGSSSSRWQSSAIVSSGSSWARVQKSSTASGSASGGTGYSTSTADPQKLPARDQELQVGAGREQLREFRGRLDHLLEVVDQEQELAFGTCSARPSFAPSVCAIVSVTSAGSRSADRSTQKTPA